MITFLILKIKRCQIFFSNCTYVYVYARILTVVISTLLFIIKNFFRLSARRRFVRKIGVPINRGDGYCDNITALY